MADLSWTGYRFQVINWTHNEFKKLEEEGWHKDSKGYCYWINLVYLAKRFAEIPGVKVDQAARDKLSQEAKQIELSRAVNSNIVIPVPVGFNYLPFQKAGIAYALPRTDTLIADEMRLGKEQPLDALVVTPKGYRKMGDIQVGDQVIGSDGKPHLVTGVFPQGFKRINTVSFNDGTSTECGDEHLWTTFPTDYKKSKKNWKVRTTNQIRATVSFNSKRGKPNLRHYIPITKPVEFENISDLPLDPYALGYIIGNGSLSKGTPGLTIPDDETLGRLTPLLPVGIQHSVDFDYRLCDKECDKVSKFDLNPLTEILKSLSLMGKRAEEKFVPAVYLYSSVTSREELIRGLLDSDGWNGENVIQFSTSSQQLAKDFLFLIQSVGCVGYYSYNPSPTYTYKGEKKIGQPSHTITVNPREGFQPFKLTRKAKSRKKFFACRAIKAVDYAGEKECQCISIDSPDGLYLTNDFIVTHNTVQACGIINADSSITNILLICPNFLKLNWAREMKNWLVRDLKGSFAGSRSVNGKTVYELDSSANIIIINYEMVKKFREEIDKRSWDLLIMDEAHFLKNPESKRTQACLGKESYSRNEPNLPAIQAKRRIALTGTPVLNRPVELWPICRTFDPNGLGSNFFAFIKKFCNAYESSDGWDSSGASNLDELQTRLRSSFMIRRTKEEVLPELPPIRRQVIPIPPEPKDKKAIADEKEFYEKHLAAFDASAVQAKIAQAEGSESTYVAAVDELKSIPSVMWSEMSRLRHKTALTKVPYVIQYIENCLLSQKKVVCFAHHRDVIQLIANHFKGSAVCHYGGMSNIDKQASVDRFKDDATCNLFLGGISLAAGYSLASASLAIFAELSWVPGDLDQSEKRLDAIDQKESILVQHLCFDQSLDITMAEKLIVKKDTIKQAVG